MNWRHCNKYAKLPCWSKGTSAGLGKGGNICNHYYTKLATFLQTRLCHVDMEDADDKFSAA